MVMYLVQILLPRADNDGKSFPRAMFDQIEKDLTAAYVGVTAYVRSPAEGLWAEEGMATADDVILFEVISAETGSTDGAFDGQMPAGSALRRAMPGSRAALVAGPSEEKRWRLR